MADKNYPPQGGQGFPQENRDGSPTLVGKDEYTKWEAGQRINKEPTTVLVGNLADLQRLGAELASGQTIAKGAVAAPPDVDPKSENVVSPGQAEAARGEWTRETERTNTLGPPPVRVPAENRDPTPVDPTSTSPQVEPPKK